MPSKMSSKISKIRGGEGMNPIYIILGVIIFVVIAYFVYTSFFTGINNLSAGQINLNVQTAPAPILVTTLTNPNSTRYAYGIWVYVNTWDNTKFKTIFSRYSDIVLYLDKDSSILKCYINPTPRPTPDAVIGDTLISSTYNTDAIFVTNNFPIQKWMYITVVIDNTKVDFYLQGKMVKSLTINQVAPDKLSNIYYGYNYDAVVSGFQRWPLPLDNQSVYNYYLNGVSSISTSSMTGGYNAKVTITKDNKQTSEFKVF